jgi:recombination protein RecT
MSTKELTIKEYMSAPAVITKMQEMFQTPEAVRQFSTAVTSIAGSDELLAVAEPRSVFNACLTAASLNLPINKNLGFAHIIGYRNNKKGIVEAQFQLGARGFKELAQRSGQYQIIHQGDVRKGELVGRNRMTGQLDFKWVEDDEERMKLPIAGYFSYFRLNNGFESTLYMSVKELNAHGQRYSQSFKKGFGPWVENHEAMCLKTVSKLNISKNGPLSVELQKAITVDQAVIKDEGKPDYIDGELADVKADEDKKQAIIDANSAPDEPNEQTESTPTPPKKTLKEKIAERDEKRKAEKADEDDNRSSSDPGQS